VVAKEPSRRPFDHFNAGKEGQRIEGYVDDDILPILSDWIVSWVEEPYQFEPPGTGTPGSFYARLRVEFNVPHESVTAVLPVLYGQYLDANGDPQWTILSGADPEGEPNMGKAKPIKGSSLSEGAIRLEFNVDIPPTTSDPKSQIMGYQPLVVKLGPSMLTVPLEPPDDAFHVPEPSSP
jgi:hypothetical protein